MPAFAELLQQGAINAWLFIPSAILLGALHGLEPGHSKTMMAAFVVAIRGTVAQAVLLGVSATISHTAIVWGIALGGMYLWRGIAPEAIEPWLQLLSGAIIVGLALWMLERSRQGRRAAPATETDLHAHHHHHRHGDHGHHHPHGGHRQHQAHANPPDLSGLSVGEQDSHQAAHASQIRARFTNRAVTTWQIVGFGLTGGLIPCPAAITVLLLCLQLREITLGATLVFSFSIGLALTLVAVGAAAAIGTRHATTRFAGLVTVLQRAPWLSGALMIIVGLYVAAHGAISLRP